MSNPTHITTSHLCTGPRPLHSPQTHFLCHTWHGANTFLTASCPYAGTNTLPLPHLTRCNDIPHCSRPLCRFVASALAASYMASSTRESTTGDLELRLSIDPAAKPPLVPQSTSRALNHGSGEFRGIMALCRLLPGGLQVGAGGHARTMYLPPLRSFYSFVWIDTTHQLPRKT